MMRSLHIILVLCIFFVGCEKDSPPGSVTLLSPAKNSECSPVNSSNNDTNVVQFSWQASSDTESYVVQVKNLDTGLSQMVPTTELSETIVVAKGTPFSWSVTSENSDVTETGSSETWFFFSPGTESSYVPFPAEIVSPNGSRGFIDTNGEVTLEWKGSDLDNDIDEYEVYYSTTSPPSLLASRSAGETTIKVAATANTDYYWRIVTKDKEGNTSDTGILSFRAI